MGAVPPAPITEVPPQVATLMERIGFTGNVALNCHVVSLAIVRAGILPNARVARGHAVGVGFGQHSWVVVGNPYNPLAHIVDATLWSYDATVPDVWQGTMRDGIHSPHGYGMFIQGERPHRHDGEPIALTPTEPLTRRAQDFLNALGPLDYRGWHQVAHLPVNGWPAREVLTAMHQTPGLSALIPIDILGMATDLNPGGLYLAGPDRS
jgi:hypothetical protein